jgi:hypothetical protein
MAKLGRELQARGTATHDDDTMRHGQGHEQFSSIRNRRIARR